jgi:hypothetical protein
MGVAVASCGGWVNDGGTMSSFWRAEYSTVESVLFVPKKICSQKTSKMKFPSTNTYYQYSTISVHRNHYSPSSTTTSSPSP